MNFIEYLKSWVVPRIEQNYNWCISYLLWLIKIALHVFISICVLLFYFVFFRKIISTGWNYIDIENTNTFNEISHSLGLSIKQFYVQSGLFIQAKINTNNLYNHFMHNLQDLIHYSKILDNNIFGLSLNVQIWNMQIIFGNVITCNVLK